MNHKNLLLLLQNNYTTIDVIFKDYMPGGKTYTYKVRRDAGIAIGDDVIVDTPKNGLTVVEVVAVHKEPKIDITANYSYKWIVQKVDMTTYLEIQKTEAAFLEAMLEVERLKQRDKLIEDFTKYLPEGSAARAMFDQATQQVLEAK